MMTLVKLPYWKTTEFYHLVMIKGVSYSFICNRIALFNPFFFGGGGQKAKIYLRDIRPKTNTPITETRFFCDHWAKIHASRRKPWTRLRNQKMKKHASVQFHPYTHPTPNLWLRSYLACGLDCGRNQTRQISSDSVRWFRSPKEGENDHPPLTLRITTVMCYIVMAETPYRPKYVFIRTLRRTLQVI